MQPVLGIDVSKRKLDICLIYNGRSYLKFCKNDNEGFVELIKWCAEKCQGKPRVCMEATGTYMEELAEFLYDNGFEVSIVNPFQIKAFAKSKLLRVKTDKSDSALIAEFCIANNPRLWNPQSLEYRELREVMRTIDSLKTQLNQISNKLESRIKNVKVKESITVLVNQIKKQIKDLEIHAKDLVGNNEKMLLQIQILTEIKGVGFLTACNLIANIPDVANFENAKQFAAFIGVTPSHFESGTSVYRRSKISKIGTAQIRKSLYMAAIVVKNRNDSFQNFVANLLKKGKPPKVIICAIMRKLMHLFFGMLKNMTHFNEKLAFGYCF
jgi:transposase